MPTNWQWEDDDPPETGQWEMILPFSSSTPIRTNILDLQNIRSDEEVDTVNISCPFCTRSADFPVNDTRGMRAFGDPCQHCYNYWSPCFLQYGNINTARLNQHRTSERITVARETRGQYEMCPDCATRNGIRQCDMCDTYSDRGGFRYVQNGVACRSCTYGWIDCDSCGNATDPNRVTECRDGEHPVRFCTRCRDRDLTYCDECGNWRRGQCFCTCTCPSCTRTRVAEESRVNDTAYMNSWGFRPRFEFHGEGKLFLGMELEVETGRSLGTCLDVVRQHLEDNNLVYLKSDGSINCGFEMVTHPMAFDWALENFPWELLDSLSTHGAYTNDQVGLHVHVNRSGFITPTHTYKWLKFIYRNQRKVTRLARRSGSNWAAFDPDDRANIKRYCKGDQSPVRYRAVNTQNDNTFEIRVFQSSLDPHEVKAALAFADASVRYTEQLSTNDILNRGGWDWSTFYAWLEDKPQYISLRAELENLACVS